MTQLRDKFKEIIEKADTSFIPENFVVALDIRSELLSASKSCEELTLEMMVGFAEWIDEKEYIYTGVCWIDKYDKVVCNTTRELVDKFLSENK